MKKFSNRVKRMAFLVAVMMILSNIVIVVNATGNDTTVTGAEIFGGRVEKLQFDGYVVNPKCLESLLSVQFKTARDYEVEAYDYWDLPNLYWTTLDNEESGNIYLRSDKNLIVGETVTVTQIIIEDFSNYCYYVADNISISFCIPKQVEGKLFFENQISQVKLEEQRISNRSLECLYTVNFEIAEFEEVWEVMAQFSGVQTIYWEDCRSAKGTIYFDSEETPKKGESITVKNIIICDAKEKYYVARNISMIFQIPEEIDGTELFHKGSAKSFTYIITDGFGKSINIQNFEDFFSLTFVQTSSQSNNMEGIWLKFSYSYYDNTSSSSSAISLSCKSDSLPQQDKPVTITTVIAYVDGKNFIAENVNVRLLIPMEKKSGKALLPSSSTSVVKFTTQNGNNKGSMEINSKCLESFYTLEFEKVNFIPSKNFWFLEYSSNDSQNTGSIYCNKSDPSPVRGLVYDGEATTPVQYVIIQNSTGIYAAINVDFDLYLTTKMPDPPETDTEPSTETETEPGTETDTEPNTETETEPGTETDTEHSTETETEPGTETDTEPNTETETEPGTETDTEPSTKPNSETNSEYESETGNKKTVIIIACSSFIVIIAIVIIAWRVKKRS